MQIQDIRTKLPWGTRYNLTSVRENISEKVRFELLSEVLASFKSVRVIEKPLEVK